MLGYFRRTPRVPVIRFQGPIGLASPLRPGLSIATAAGALERAFRMSRTPSVAIVVNSPGGSPVQSHLIYKRIRQLAEEHGKRVYVFCEDVAASGGYFLALAGDEINADPSTIVGSIGVVSAGFGFDKAIARWGVERRVHTTGDHKGMLDPFRPEQAGDVERLRAVQRDVLDSFVGVVKARRGDKLAKDQAELFSGAFWSAKRALQLGLIDGIDDVRTRMRAVHGDKVRLDLVPIGQTGLLSRFRRFPGMRSAMDAAAGLELSADDWIAAMERRALWARFGL